MNQWDVLLPEKGSVTNMKYQELNLQYPAGNGLDYVEELLVIGLHEWPDTDAVPEILTRKYPIFLEKTQIVRGFVIILIQIILGMPWALHKWGYLRLLESEWKLEDQEIFGMSW